MRRPFGLCLPLILSSLVATAACDPSASREHHKRAVTRYFDEVWNAGQLDVLDELLAADYINHTPSTPNPPPGPAGLKPIIAAIRGAFPDLHFAVEDILVDGDDAVARVRMQGTQRGDLFGLPASGKRVDVLQMNIERFVDGRIREHWRVTDELTMMRQLGAVP